MFLFRRLKEYGLKNTLLIHRLKEIEREEEERKKEELRLKKLKEEEEANNY